MSDVIWHRPAWWQVHDVPAVPDTERGEAEPVVEVAGDAEAAAGDSADLAHRAGRKDVVKRLEEVIAEAREEQLDEHAKRLQRSATAERLQWLKRHVRFGTVLQERRANGRFILNVTQACDVQHVLLDQVTDAGYLFIRGDLAPVDVGVKGGGKMVESQYFHRDRNVDSFQAFHWNLRQAYTPRISDLLGELEDYQIVGQLRYESAYRVLAKFASQATRVAEIRMPKFYRWPVHIFQLNREKKWVLINREVPLSSSAWSMTKMCRAGKSSSLLKRLLLRWSLFAI